MWKKSPPVQERGEWASLGFGNHKVFGVPPFTRDLQAIEKAVSSLRPSGDTPLRYGEAKAAAYLLKNGAAPEGKLIILCDGEDNCTGPAHRSSNTRQDPSSGNAAKSKLKTLFRTLKLPQRNAPSPGP